MTKVLSKTPSFSASSILSRFAKVFSAQSVEGLLQSGFFIYLAWMDQFVFGEVQYAYAASALVAKITQYGLYFPIVTHLGEAEEDAIPEILNRANIIKLFLTIVTTLGLVVICVSQGFSLRMSLMVIFICLGYALEQIVEGYFAKMRIKGRQGEEAKIKAAASVVSYGYGAGVMALGLNPLLMSLYRIVSTLVRFLMSLRIFLRDHPGRLFAGTSFGPVKAMFKYASVFAFIQILGVFLNKTNVFFLERYVGVKGVAHYSAGFMAVDGISVLASEQLLSWVIFPLLSVLWWKKREEVAPLIRNTALWLMAISLPLMFVIYAESAMIIDLIYPEGFQDAIWVQQTLTPCIFIAFENNLFCFVMMVVGSAKLLLAFSIIGALVNMILNITLTPGYGLLGACLVIVLSKLTMMIQTGFYCQWKLKLFRGADFLFPLILGGSLLMIHILLKPIISIHAATIIPLVIYGLVLWRLGPRIMGELRKREDLALD